MKFLLEAEEENVNIENDSQEKLSGDLFSLKQQLEKERNISYDNLSEDQKYVFIQDVINKAKNKDTLSKARLEAVNSIKDSRWDKDIVNFINDIPNNVNIDDRYIDLVTTLISTKKLDYNKSKEWLTNTSLFNRDAKDLDTAVKALALVDNPAMQQKGDKKLFTKDLSVKEDFMDGNTIIQSDKIKNILDDNSNPEIDLSDKSVAKQMVNSWKEYLKSQQTKLSDEQIDKATAETNKKITDDLFSALTGTFGINDKEARKLISDNFRQGETFEYLLREILRGLGRGA